MSNFDRVEACISRLKEGGGILLLDDNDREDEADLVYAGSLIKADDIAFMMSNCRGLICLSITEKRRLELNIPLQVSINESTFGTNFGMPFCHIDSPVHAISAAARAHVISEASKAKVNSCDFVIPGCVVPVVAREGGVLRRRGQTEGSVDLVRLAGLEPAGVICEVLDEQGSVLRGEAVSQFAKKFNLPLCTVEEVVQYRRHLEFSVRKVGELDIPSAELLRERLLISIPEEVPLSIHVFVNDVDNSEHFALVFGDLSEVSSSLPLCRIHSECLTGDVFASLRCDCGEQLDKALQCFIAESKGILLYLQQEGRGIGLANKLRAYVLQDEGLDTIEANIELGFNADGRDYRVAAEMLKILKTTGVRLLTNNPSKITALKQHGIQVKERIPIQVVPRNENVDYLEVKSSKMGHLLS